MSAKVQDLPKKHRLKGKKLISELFRSGQQIFVFPFKLIYLPLDFSTSDPQGFLFGTSVPKKKFKKAVDRNRIKRLIREAYRLNKPGLHSGQTVNSQDYALMYIYVGNDNPDLKFLIKRIRKLHTALIAKINQENNAI